MNLIIDIGNTRAKLLAMEGGQPIDETLSDSETLAELHDFVHRHSFSQGIVSTVANVGEQARKTLEQIPFPLLWLDCGTALPIPSSLPPTMGSDRIAAIVGAVTAMPETPLLVVDAGTCVTYEFLDDSGRYLGGNIAPGLKMRMMAMHEHTARLPLVEVLDNMQDMGFDTESAMRAGATAGLKHEVEGYIQFFRKQYPRLQVFLTGGDTLRLDEDLQEIIHTDHYLVPRGLDCILTFNSKILITETKTN